MKNYYVEATILAVAIVVFGTFVKKSLDRFTDKEVPFFRPYGKCQGTV